MAYKRTAYTNRVALFDRRNQADIKQEMQEEQKKKAFFKTLEKSKDLADNLPALVDFLKKHTSATGVYIGKL